MDELRESFNAIHSKLRDLFNRVNQLEAAPLITSSSGGGAPVDATYLVNSANAILTNEIVVTATQGALIYGNAAPTWAVLAHPGAANRLLITNATDVLWSTYTLVGTGGQTYTFGTTGGTIPTSPGTLTAATANTITAAGVITHAITTTSDGQTNPSTILAAGASGELRLASLGIGTAVGYPLDIGGTYTNFIVNNDATTTSVTGLSVAPRMTGTTGGTRGMFFNPNLSPGGNVTTFFGEFFNPLLTNSNKNITSYTAGFRVRYDIAAGYSGTLAEVRQVYIETPTILGSAPTTLNGLYIDPQTGASGTNYSIQTNGGLHILRDHTSVFVSDAVTNAITEATRRNHATSGVAAARFGVGHADYLEDSANNMQQASQTATLWAVSTSGSESPLYRITTFPTGSQGPGYSGHWTWNGVDGTARTVIPSGNPGVAPTGNGDVTCVITVMYAVCESGGGTSGNVTTATLGGGAVTLYTDGVDTLSLTVAADGSVTVQRTAGAATFKVSLWMTWI